MSGSNLTPFNFIPENSLATPGLWNSVFSTLSQNIAEANTGSVLSGGISLGTQGLTINVPSNVTDYIFLNDSANLRSSYAIGSFNSGTADGLNIWDASGQTMIVSFSKQSVRFYQQVVGPVFDVGGALASTLNAATFGGSLITTQIQAAISAASLAVPKIKRVYIPASMYPYDPRQISYDTNVQMVREGGSWDVYDVLAYGANPTLSVADAWSTTGIQRALNAAQGAGGGITYVPTGNYAVSSLTVGRSTTLRGAGGGRHLDATTVAQLYQASAATTLLFLADQGGSGTIVENIQLSASGNNNSLGIVQIAGMSFTLLRNVAISVGSAFGVRYLGGADTNFNALLDCAITVSSFGTAVDVSCNSTAVCDSTPYMAGCFVTTNSPAQAWLSFRSVSGGNAPDSPIIVNNRFFSSSTLTAVYGQVTNARILGNRFEVIGGGLNVTLASPDGEPPAEFIANSYGLTGGTLIWTDTSLVVATRLQELVGGVTINAIPGTAIVPSYALGSENSLGWYRSAASTMALSYGTLALPSGLTAAGSLLAGAGTALAPAHGFVSENSLGLFRSGKSSLALSYGSFRLPVGAEVVWIASGSNPPMRMWNSTNQGFLSLNRDLSFTPDNNAFASWLLQVTAQAGSADNILWAHTIPGGASSTKWSLDSLGNVAGGSGTALNPSYQFLSENSLGWYRSAASVMALSYGGLGVKNGTNASFGTATLGSNGSVNVATTYVAAGDVIFLTDQTAGGTLGDIELGGIRAGSGFTIQSTSITDTSTVGWLIVRPAV